MDRYYTDLQIVDRGEGWDYRVDAVRESLDENGLKRQQRLTAARYPSQGEAEDHQAELDAALAGEGWGDLADKLREQPYERTAYHLAVNPPPELWSEPDEDAHLALVAYSGDHIAQTTIANGDRATMERYAASLEDVQALGGDDVLLEASRDLAAGQGLIAPDAPLFDDHITPERQLITGGYTLDANLTPTGADGIRPVHHIDGGGAAHWFGVVETEAQAYELRYFRALAGEDGTIMQDSHPLMPLPDDDPNPWPLPALEMYLQKGDVYMAQQFAHDVADAYGQDFPEPHDLPALDPQPEYYFGYGVSDSNRPSLEAVKTWMEGAERRFDTLTINEYDNYEEAAIDEYILDTALATDGVEHALNIAEGWATDNGYLDPQRDDPRIFFEDDAPPDPFTTNRQREMPDYGFGAISANGEHFIDVVKSWGDGEYERLTIPQPSWEQAQLHAEMAFTDQENGDLQAAMRRMEALAEDAGVLDPKRADGRLFTQGPPDPFETMRQQDLRENPFLYGAWPPDMEDDLSDDFNPFLDDEPPQAVENPYWRFDTLPVEDPDGEALGVALHVVRYPTVEAHPGVIGSPTVPDDAPFELLEVAHFETSEAADRFADDFVSYLQPGVLDGPELAEEVARMEGHPAAWRALDADELAAYEDLTLTLTRDRADWRAYGGRDDMDEIDADTERDVLAPGLDL